MQLTLGERRLPLASERLGIALDGLHRDRASRAAWWLADVPPLPRGSTIVHAIQLGSEQRGRVVTALAGTPLPETESAYVTLCLSNREQGGIKLGDYYYFPILSWHPRNGPR